MTASPVNTRAKQTQMKVAEAVWQLERNMDAQVITVIDRDPVTAAAPLPELKLLYYVRQHTSDSLKEVEGETYHVGLCQACQQCTVLLWVLCCLCGMLAKTSIHKPKPADTHLLSVLPPKARLHLNDFRDHLIFASHSS